MVVDTSGTMMNDRVIKFFFRNNQYVDVLIRHFIRLITVGGQMYQGLVSMITIPSPNASPKNFNNGQIGVLALRKECYQMEAKSIWRST